MCDLVITHRSKYNIPRLGGEMLLWEICNLIITSTDIPISGLGGEMLLE